MSLLPHLERTTHPQPTASVIWLHGLGASGDDFYPIVSELSLPKDAAIRFIFPHAPAIAVTINNGFVMPAWYDILEMQLERKVDERQLRASSAEVVKLIENEHARGIAYERIIVIGFSQGGAVAYEAALSFEHRLGGLLAMSTYFATKNSILLHSANSQLPVEIHHGKFDPVVPVQLGHQSRQYLEAHNYSVNYVEYPMEHSVCQQQIDDISQFIQKIVC